MFSNSSAIQDMFISRLISKTNFICKQGRQKSRLGVISCSDKSLATLYSSDMLFGHPNYYRLL